MFADAFTKDVPVPNDPSQTVTIRRLSWAELQEAGAANTKKAMQYVRDVGDSAIREIAQQAKQGANAEIARDPFNAYDMATLLRYGIKSWSYQRPVTPENVALIDDVAAPYLARQIFDFTKGAQTKVEQKND